MSTASGPPERGAGQNTGVTAIVVAGDRSDSHPVFGQNKALLELEGEPIIVHAVRALQRVEEISRVFVVGPADELRAALAVLQPAEKQLLTVLEQRQSLIENCLVGFRRSLTDDESVELESLEEEHADATAFFMTGDIPFVTPEELSDFIQNADMSTFDYVVGLTPVSLLLPFYPAEDRLVVGASAMHAAEGIFRPANLHMIRPFAIKARELTEHIYAFRYQKKIRNAFGLLSAVGKSVGGYHALLAFIYVMRMQLAMAASLRGRTWLANIIRAGVKLSKVAFAASRLGGARLGVRVCSSPGSALDIDKERDFVVARDGFDRWKAMLGGG